MANEFQIRMSLQARARNLSYQSQPTSFQDDLIATNPNGPTPGTLAVPLAGANVDLSQLTTPGWCFLYNLGSGNDASDLTCFVLWGAFDPTVAVHEFVPVCELGVGEGCVVKLSRLLGQEFGTTPGTTPTGTNSRLRLKSVGAIQYVRVEAFER